MPREGPRLRTALRLTRERRRPRPLREGGRCLLADPLAQLRTLCQTLGQGPAGATVGPTCHSVRACRRSTPSTSARGRTRTRPWA
eukprot:3887939-Alexandrium_andersonii.AAC.1